MEIRVFAKSRSSNIYIIACASSAGTGAKADVLLACLSCLHLAAGTGVFFREAISWPDMEIASRRTLAMTSWFDFNNTLEWKLRTIAAASALDYTGGMQITNTFIPKERGDWRRWLEEHGSSESEVWLIYYKAGTGKSGISYNDSLEEALCFGWVDSIIQKIDEEKYARKFTPRKAGSKWSDLNKHLVAKLVQQGRMTAAGLVRVDFPLSEAPAARPKRPKLPLPDWLKAGLMTSPGAWENFQRLAPSHQHNYIGWISDAKKEETRQKRLQEAIERLEKNATLGLK